MHRRSLIAGAAIVSLTGTIIMSDTADAQTKSDPENTLYMDLKQGRVVIEMFPDIAPKAVERRIIVEPLARQRLDALHRLGRNVREHLDHHTTLLQVHVQLSLIHISEPTRPY